MVEYTRIVASTRDSFSGWIAGTGSEDGKQERREK